jgi:soluble lytic murein transglycosylase
MVIAAPRTLSRLDGNLSRRLLSSLGPEERLQRARAWRREGRPARAASELRSHRWKGELETERRREVGRADIDAGSPLAALRVLPRGRDAGAVDFELRARAFRNRAWSLWPKNRSQSEFRECLAAAERALALEPDAETRRNALVLRLECATETGRLDTAFASWRLLEEDGWADSRRTWLGRRLGVALAHQNDGANRALEIGRALPSQARCLRFWTASRAASRDAELESLADVPIPDLYATWSLETLGRAALRSDVSAPAASPGAPPVSVQRLLDAGAKKQAAREWRRIRRARRPTPEEAFTAALFSARQGLANDAIIWLRSGFPELGTVEATRAPKNVVEAYLPLRWRSTLMAVAAEFDLDPWLVAGVARQESTFTAHAVSPRGAVGVLQLLPSTARGHARALGLSGSPDLRDAEINLRLGARELARLLRRFGAVEPALAAYNGGETRIRSWWKRQPDHHVFTEEIPIPETYTYVRRVIYLREAYRQVYAQTQGGPR